jgi:hypothetical protein
MTPSGRATALSGSAELSLVENFSIRVIFTRFFPVLGRKLLAHANALASSLAETGRP